MFKWFYRFKFNHEIAFLKSLVDSLLIKISRKMLGKDKQLC